MNIEGPHRELPKDDSVFDPEKHEKTLHTKGPLKGKETWVRKTAVQSDEEAKLIAEKRHSVKKEKSTWLKRLFGFKKEPYLDVLTEQGLNEHLQGFHFTFTGKMEGFGWGRASGMVNGHRLEMDTDVGNHPYNYDYDPRSFLIDGEKIAWGDAEMIAKKILPLLAQWFKNKQQTEKLGAETKINLSKQDRAVLEVLGKLPPRKTPELKSTDEQKQLGPKKEE